MSSNMGNFNSGAGATRRAVEKVFEHQGMDCPLSSEFGDILPKNQSPEEVRSHNKSATVLEIE